MTSLEGVYDTRFYNAQRDGSKRSAQKIVPFIVDALRPISVIDLGCGVGTWLAEFKTHGVSKVLGVDGVYAPRAGLCISESEFCSHDLRRPFNTDDQFDLAMSLEVAEHLPPLRATSLVSDLTRLSPVVLFSAACPGQSGDMHINERWQSFWIDKFAEQGYAVIDALRSRFWGDDSVEWWYSQNAFLFARADRASQLMHLATTMPPDVLHPRSSRAALEPTHPPLSQLIRAIPKATAISLTWHANALKRRLRA